MSSKQLTHIETELLAKSLNFSITSKTLPNIDIIDTIEDVVKVTFFHDNLLEIAEIFYST